MKVKLDENLSKTHRTLLAKRGYDVATVQGEGLRGCPDDKLWLRVMVQERRDFFREKWDEYFQD